MSLVQIEIPQMGANITEGKLLRWFKHPGELVEEMEPLYELETSKAVFEIESERRGVLLTCRSGPGPFKQGEVIGTMECEA